MLIMYAADITIFSQDRKIEIAEQRINNYLAIIQPYLLNKQLIISVDKCSNMLFSTWTKNGNEYSTYLLVTLKYRQKID